MEFGVNPLQSNQQGILPKDLLPDPRFAKLLEIGGSQATFDLYDGSNNKNPYLPSIPFGQKNFMGSRVGGGTTGFSKGNNTLSSLGKSSLSDAGALKTQKTGGLFPKIN